MAFIQKNGRRIEVSGQEAAKFLPSLARAKRNRTREVAAKLAEVYAAGFAYDFGDKTATLEDGTTEAAGVRVLQIGTEIDRANWLTVAQVAALRVGAGAPNEAMRPFRCADNARVPMTAAEALTAVLAMQSYAGRALEASWDHKDAIRALTTVQAVFAYNINTGWPGDS